MFSFFHDRETDTDEKQFAQVITIGKNRDRNSYYFQHAGLISFGIASVDGILRVTD